jgi:hypothetical protein
VEREVQRGERLLWVVNVAVLWMVAVRLLLVVSVRGGLCGKSVPRALVVCTRRKSRRPPERDRHCRLMVSSVAVDVWGVVWGGAA